MKLWIIPLLLAPTVAHAASLEIGAGSSSYHAYGDGIWYQLGEPHRLNTHSHGYLIGVRFQPTEWWDIHIDYVNFGNVSTSCLCTWDSNYDAQAHKVIHKDGPSALFNGYGHVDAIQIKNTWYAGHVGLNAGAAIYRNHWHETVYNLTGPDNTKPISAAISASDKIRIAPMVGVSVREGLFTLSADEILMKTLPVTSGVPPLWEKVSMVSITYTL